MCSSAFTILLFISTSNIQITSMDTVPKGINNLTYLKRDDHALFSSKYDDETLTKGDLKLWKRRRRMSEILDRRSNVSGEVKETRLPIKYSKYEVNELVSSEANNEVLIKKFKELWPVNLWRRFGLFTDDYLHLVNPYWLSFAPPHPLLHYGLGAFYIMMTTVGSTGNALVMFMYFRCRSLRTPGNILVANLALSDFMMLAKTPIFIFNSFNLGPALGKTGCVIYGFVGGLTGTTSIAILTAISLDRYWAVVRPLEPLRALTAIRARLMAIAAWIYATLFAIIPALDIGYGRYVPEGFLTSCSFDYLTEELPPRYFIFVFFCAAWLAPFCTISYCYISIFRVVVCSRNITTKNQEQRLSTRHVKERTKRKAEIKLAFLVIVVIALFFISWTPYAIVALLGIFGKKDLIKPLTSMIPALFCKTAACINPFIYIITHPKFRKEFKRMLSRDKTERSGTIKTIGYYTEASKFHRPSKDFSDTEVEIVEMKDIPYRNEDTTNTVEEKINTVSAKLAKREGSQKSQSSISMKSFEENVVSPPSWYCKPKFAKKKSFHRRSTHSMVSQNTDPTV
ncbi:opsin, ultraviolet-sensitive-like [Bombyx mandarina]|uniref:Opsin, ultraviolet-sensitive-like n=1 Tax=Bombyx mandarina TaxID=7092 RepID=A0A6J2JPP4_BOMMA|nr:opsin, ultraviolet-sensitive-like [Bombyx mandarina]